VGRTARNISGFTFYRRQSAIIDQSRNPPPGDVSCRHCGEDDETPIHIICDCGHFVEHRLDTIRSGSQQLTSGFGGANIGMASAELGGKGWKHHDKAY
jgi:hypothetical protein